MHKAATRLLDELVRYPDARGHGDAAGAFAADFLKVARRFLEVHGKAVVGIGGAAIGLTVTANNYGMADAASHPAGNGTFTPHPLPVVISAPPAYGSVPVLGIPGDDLLDELLDVLGDDLGGVAASVMRPVIEHALRTGRALEILPLPNYLHVNSISQAWLGYVYPVGEVDVRLISLINGITDVSNTAWQEAMLAFCSSLWGTTSWGQSREGQVWSHDTAGSPGMNHPVLGVLTTSADGLARAFREYAEAAKEVRDELRGILYRAVRDSLALVDTKDGFWGNLKELPKRVAKAVEAVSVGIVLNLDTDAINRAVDRYSSRIRDQQVAIKGLVPALDEAFRSAPSFQSEAARAEAFGARSLNEFKSEHTYTVPNEDPNNHYYPIDLANQENLSGAHAVERHVGLTDEQLAQRLRDQQKLWPDGIVRPVAASTFPDLATAQRFTQAALDDTDTAAAIERWIERQKQNYNPASQPSYSVPFVTEQTGTSIDRATYDAQGLQATGTPVHSVKLTLRYDPTLPSPPPFVVLTSVPEAP